jgi:hypothetical protein
MGKKTGQFVRIVTTASVILPPFGIIVQYHDKTSGVSARLRAK